MTWYTAALSLMRDFLLVLGKFFKQTAGELPALKIFMPNPCCQAFGFFTLHNYSQWVSHGNFSPSMVGSQNSSLERCLCERVVWTAEPSWKPGLWLRIRGTQMPLSTPASEIERLNRALRCCKLWHWHKRKFNTRAAPAPPAQQQPSPCKAFCCHSCAPTDLSLGSFLAWLPPSTAPQRSSFLLSLQQSQQNVISAAVPPLWLYLYHISAESQAISLP